MPGGCGLACLTLHSKYPVSPCCIMRLRAILECTFAVVWSCLQISWRAAGGLDIRRQLAVGEAVLKGAIPFGAARPLPAIASGSMPVQTMSVLPPAKAMPHWPAPLQGNKLAQASSCSALLLYVVLSMPELTSLHATASILCHQKTKQYLACKLCCTKVKVESAFMQVGIGGIEPPSGQLARAHSTAL